MPLLFGGLTALCFALALAAVPMLRDQGPVERLGGRIGVHEPRERRSLVARLVVNLAGRLGPRLAPSLRLSRRSALEAKLGYAGRPMTVQGFIGLKAALALLLGPGVGGLLLLLG